MIINRLGGTVCDGLKLGHCRYSVDVDVLSVFKNGMVILKNKA